MDSAVIRQINKKSLQMQKEMERVWKVLVASGYHHNAIADHIAVCLKTNQPEDLLSIPLRTIEAEKVV